MISDRITSNLRRTFRESLLPKIGMVLLVSIVLMAVFAPLLATHDPTRTGYYDEGGNAYPPIGFDYTTQVAVDGEIREIEVTSESAHVLGTNNVGQDVYSRFVYGARISLLVGFSATLIAMLIGVPIGLIAGYYGGRVDDALMRVADGHDVGVPGARARTGVDRGVRRVPGVRPRPDRGPRARRRDAGVDTDTGDRHDRRRARDLGVVRPRRSRGGALATQRGVRQSSQELRDQDRDILLGHILPNSITPIIVLGTIQVAVIILLEASLAYLGFSGTTLSWGYEIERGQDILRTRPWVSTLPGIGIVLTVIAVNLLGDWFRDALDPNMDEGQRGV